MKKPIIFTFPEYKVLAKNIIKSTGYKLGEVTIREFPDKESFVQIHTEVKNKDVIILCGLDRPNEKAVSLIFLLSVCKQYGAKSAGLVAPYLGYMRQDKIFHKGELISSEIFGALLSKYMNWAITIDPHLHRHSKMSEVYSVPFKVLHAADLLSEWIKNNLKKVVLVGPDSESEQWVSSVAKKARVPFIVLQKVRRGDKDVKVSVPDVEKYKNYTPVLVDDIISTARTMVRTVEHLHKAKMKDPICIGIHAVFAGDGYEALTKAKVKKIITSNTITHKTNEIDVSELISDALKKKFK
ncbi:ribose-phosphate diphosphokinase [Pseudomonadota bacterium]